MSSQAYAEMIIRLPEVDVHVTGVRGWLSQGKDHQIVFFAIDPAIDIPLHSHGEQWGIVVEGELDLTIGGQTKRYRAGDSYHIPAGVEHGARILTRFRAIDVFADADRYKPKG